MTTLCHAAPPTPNELSALLRLLDDETPAVRQQVAERIDLCGGDLSEWLATQPRALTAHEQSLLRNMLRPARRVNLVREWISPSGGAAALQEDWETFESLLRVLSDFLHDGMTLRQPLSDALDLLAEEATEGGVSSASELAMFLFQGDDPRLEGNRENYEDPQNSDLAWCLAHGRSNPIGLGLIYLLLGRRLELEIEGVNFPGHFLCRFFEDGFPVIVDCFDGGQLHLQASLLESPELTRDQRTRLRQTADLGTILLRLLNNLHHAFEKTQRTADAALILKLRATLE